MKRIYTMILIISLATLHLIACGKRDDIIIISKTVEYGDLVDITYPYAVSKNKALAEEINRSILRSCLNDDVESFEWYIDEAKEYEKDSIGYEISIDWNGYENENIISLCIVHYSYGGGAHGNTSALTLNFDKSNGKRINLMDYVSDQERFRQIFIDEFIRQNDIDTQLTLGEQGYYFVNDISELHIPTSMLLDECGINMHYGQYEIAPYAAGMTFVTIRYELIDNIFTLNTNGFREILQGK